MCPTEIQNGATVYWVDSQERLRSGLVVHRNRNFVAVDSEGEICVFNLANTWEPAIGICRREAVQNAIASIAKRVAYLNACGVKLLEGLAPVPTKSEGANGEGK